MAVASIEAILKDMNDALAGFAPQSSRYETPPSDRNEFLLFLKPSITASLLAGNAGSWGAIVRALETYGVELHGRCALSGRVLRERRLIRDHYGVINSVSELGTGAFDQTASKGYEEFLEKHPGTVALGAHQFLDRFPDLSPSDVTSLFTSGGELLRLSGGTYGVAVEYDGQDILLLNGFHPEQVATFEDSTSVILAFQASSPKSWRTLRQEMIGATNPHRAEQGSIRAELLVRRDAFGIGDVSSLRNGIHMSAGPIEGMVEIGRFLLEAPEPSTAVDLPSTSFAKSLRTVVSSGEALAMARNGYVFAGSERLPAFDATELLDTDDLLTELREGKLRVDMVH